MSHRVSIVLLFCCSVAAPLAARAQEEPATPIACESTADCPLALECETTRIVESCPTAPAGDQAPPSDAGCTIEEEPIESPSCVYAPVRCTDEADCASGLTCQALGRVSECNSSPEPAGEPVCIDRWESYCFPMRDDCTDSSECDEGWRCTMLPEGALSHPPAGWEGATKLCVPEGIALVLEGRVELSSRATISSAEADGRVPASNDGGAISDHDGPVKNTSLCSATAVLPAFGSVRHSGVQALMLLALGVLVRRRRAASS
jgi:hypothetical protein